MLCVPSARQSLVHQIHSLLLFQPEPPPAELRDTSRLPEIVPVPWVPVSDEPASILVRGSCTLLRVGQQLVEIELPPRKAYRVEAEPNRTNVARGHAGLKRRQRIKCHVPPYRPPTSRLAFIPSMRPGDQRNRHGEVPQAEPRHIERTQRAQTLPGSWPPSQELPPDQLPCSPLSPWQRHNSDTSATIVTASASSSPGRPFAVGESPRFESAMLSAATPDAPAESISSCF